MAMRGTAAGAVVAAVTGPAEEVAAVAVEVVGAGETMVATTVVAAMTVAAKVAKVAEMMAVKVARVATMIDSGQES